MDKEEQLNELEQVDQFKEEEQQEKAEEIDQEEQANLNDLNDLNEEDKKDVKVKGKNKTGVVYLTKIPPGRNYTRIREIFEKFAPIGNIYLVPDKLANNKLQKKGKTYKSYKEGFVEFKRKKDAKNFTTVFNGASLKSTGSNVPDGFIWDIKYLHRYGSLRHFIF